MTGDRAPSNDDTRAGVPDSSNPKAGDRFVWTPGGMVIEVVRSSARFVTFRAVDYPAWIVKRARDAFADHARPEVPS